VTRWLTTDCYAAVTQTPVGGGGGVRGGDIGEGGGRGGGGKLKEKKRPDNPLA